MSIYLFRAGSSRTFADSLDVTGRNIPPVTEQEKWGFERTVNAEQFKAHPEALQRIWEDGFYIFNCSCRARGNRYRSARHAHTARRRTASPGSVGRAVEIDLGKVAHAGHTPLLNKWPPPGVAHGGSRSARTGC